MVSGRQSGPIISYRLDGMLCFLRSSSLDMHSVSRCLTVRVVPHEGHSVGVWLFMRCPWERRVWPILRWVIIISVFLVVLVCGQGFIFCFISCNLFFWFTQWFCHMFRVKIFIWFFVSIIVLYFCLGASDNVAFFACWSASSFPFILQWPGVHMNLIFLFRFFNFSTWFMMVVAISFVWNVFWMEMMVLKESVNIL